MVAVPADSWDCHVHVFDPIRFPFREDRVYTPSPASVDDLVGSTKFDGIVIVQASPENGVHGLLAQLQEAKARYPSKIFRASIITEHSPGQDVATFSESYIDMLHTAGVRSIRIQGVYTSVGSELDHVREYICDLARSYPVTSRGWAISMQMPLGVWGGLHNLLLDTQRGELRNAHIVAEHNACATPSDISSPEFQSFLTLLTSGRVYVKISALYRRSPAEFRRMKAVVEAFANAAPDRILWGTDWPHIVASPGGLRPTPNNDRVDSKEELEAVRGWISDEQWHSMLVRNPARLFL